MLFLNCSYVHYSMCIFYWLVAKEAPNADAKLCAIPGLNDEFFYRLVLFQPY